MTDKNDNDLMMKIGTVIFDAKQKIKEANDLLNQLDPENIMDLKISLIADLSVNGKPVSMGLVGGTEDMLYRVGKLADKIHELDEEAKREQEEIENGHD